MKNNNKIGICTLYTGYNYGSALQAFSTKYILKTLNYDSDIIKLSGSIISGRDIRIKKSIISFFRAFFYSNNKRGTIKSYFQYSKHRINEITINKFDIFYKKYIIPKFISYHNLKKIAKKEEYSYFICGSDQIWNSAIFYVDPFYYLQFAPKKKRIAYAPSFGRTYIPEYNRKIIKKYIEGINSISVREESAKLLIKELIKKDVPICLDPTLLLTKEEWIDIFSLKKRQ